MSDSDDFQAMQMTNPNIGRRTYLITYSQADREKIPTREYFGSVIEKHFNEGTSKAKVQFWACCLEDHKDGGQHYHLSLKLSAPKKWKQVKERIASEQGIMVHFSDKHDHYIAAYRYVCKCDKDVFHSPNHPDLRNAKSPKTKKPTKAYRESRKRKAESSGEQPASNAQRKVRRLSNDDVARIIVRNDIKREKELFALAKMRKNEGESDLSNFILAKSSRSISELMVNTWKLENANSEIEREKSARIDLVREKLKQPCATGCDNKLWLACAVEVLTKNGIQQAAFAAIIREALIKGRGKFRNILIIGPANCAKTFILKPLEKIFHVFSNPSNDKYAWIGADSAEVIILQDFRWNRETISWRDLLLLLEGETVKLPAPKNQYAGDVVICKDTPIFATSKDKVRYRGSYNTSDERETEMMSVRWKVVEFHHQIAQSEQKYVPPCERCFAELILTGE